MAKAPRGLVEKRPTRPVKPTYASVLIVCEGKKTEPNYLKELKNDLRMSTADVTIVGEGRDPSAVVEQAINMSEDSSADYDYIFCVFDRDMHARYSEACNRCAQKQLSKEDDTPVQLVAITSNPSFEYWLLLHLNQTTKPYRMAGRKSSGDVVLAEFQKAFKADTKTSYTKGARGIYQALRPKLDEAIKYSARNNRDGLRNPHSLIGDLVTLMRSIANGQRPDLKAIRAMKREDEDA
ncbi:RloB family protein [Luteibacter sp. 329MFSha]|uniref:RloB family protein n=1 Tax=Luteibacter sp. 329MFSha TaxID=1798239 RepID=UPI0008B63E71|nr:RloB family protein [Luteibacter sp. 329MFSha]SEW25597.1 RloB-like protein [Luteibacter sp. 329MFSha]